MGAIAAALIGAAASAGTAAYSAHQQKKAQEKQAEALGGADVGKKPEAAMYKPVDFDQEQLDTILGNKNALEEIKGLVNGTNTFITNDALRRAEKLIPGYSSSMRAMGLAANDLISARLPSDVVDRLVGDRAGASNAIGIPGLAGPATLKDLGLTSLDAINQGTGLLGQMVGMAETVSPRSSYMSPEKMMLSPTDRIQMTMNQNSLIQQSEQSRNNLEAGANPTDMARLGMALGNGAGGGGGGDVNWAQVGGSAAQSLLKGYQDYTANRGYDPKTGFYTTPEALTKAYAAQGQQPLYAQAGNNQFYFTGYRPVATTATPAPTPAATATAPKV